MAKEPEIFQLESTVICEHCGVEHETGLMNYVNHWNVCKNDAPNSSIKAHWHNVEYQAWLKELEIKNRQEEIDFAPIYLKMSIAERQQLVMLSMCGLWDHRTNTILMGMKALTNYKEYKNKMIKTYGTQTRHHT